MKACSVCKQEKTDEGFGKDRRATTGLKSECRKCGSARNGAWNRRHKEKYNAYRNRYNITKRAYSLVGSAKKRAMKRGLAFDLDVHIEKIQKRIDAGLCEVSGVPFNLHGPRTFDSPSIDRIIPCEGYVYTNIRIVCNVINAALGDWGEEVLYAVVDIWRGKRLREGHASTDACVTETTDSQPSIVTL